MVKSLKAIRKQLRKQDEVLTRQIEETQKIRNRPLAIILDCAYCDARVGGRTGLDSLLALGWAIGSHDTKAAVCPMHNPASRIFIGYHTPKGIQDGR